MTEVITNTCPVLPDSGFKSRPQIDAYFRPDSSAGLNAQKQIDVQRLRRQTKFPSLNARKDYDSFQTKADDALYPAFKKYNDKGDWKPPEPFRSFDNVIDPISGFVSIGGDVDRGTNVKRIPCLVQLNHTPQSMIPQQVHSIRKGMKSAPPEVDRLTEWDKPGPYEWNSRVMSERAIRSALGGWTSHEDPRKVTERNKLDPFKARDANDTAREKRDQLALKYMYTSATQRQYQDVEWDENNYPRKYPPVRTFEYRPDEVSYRVTSRQSFTPVNNWQHSGPDWDVKQSRYGHYGYRPVSYTSANPRVNQIPGYSGCVGAVNLDEIDNSGVNPFSPFTIKRVPIPRPVQTAGRPNIPGYAGCTLYRRDSKVAHADNPVQPPLQTTANVHREMPVSPNNSEHKREGLMSKLVTTVPPCNPFNKIETEQIEI